MEVNILEAKTHLSRLIEKALTGEDLVIATAGRPLVRLEVIPHKSLVRHQMKLARITHSIKMNPVKAGLAATPEEFAWSSAAG